MTNSPSPEVPSFRIYRPLNPASARLVSGAMLAVRPLVEAHLHRRGFGDAAVYTGPSYRAVLVGTNAVANRRPQLEEAGFDFKEFQAAISRFKGNPLDVTLGTVRAQPKTRMARHGRRTARAVVFFAEADGRKQLERDHSRVRAIACQHNGQALQIQTPESFAVLRWESPGHTFTDKDQLPSEDTDVIAQLVTKAIADHGIRQVRFSPFIIETGTVR